MLGQEIHGLGGLFQIVQLRPMGEACALLCLNVILDINEQADLSVPLFRLVGRSGASGDPGGKGFFGVVHTQGFQTGESFLIRRSGRDIFAPLDLIAFSLQAAKQFFQIGTGWQEPVDGRFQLRLIAGAILRGLMFNIALTLVLSWDDNGQTVFLAKPVRSAADIVITPLVGMIVLVIREADRIENQMVMDVILVYVGGQHKFILAAQDFFCKFHAYFMGLFRRNLPRLKGLDQVAAQICSLVDGMAAGPGKFDIRSFGGTAIGGYKQFSVRLFRVADDHVSFAYQTTQPGPDGKPVVIEDEVLHDISFTAKAGQKTALVGESGSGKSTLAKLLIHYYDPQKGSISIGGQKLCDMSLEALNSRISYVAQDQYLFNTSLLENIRLGRLNATDEEVVEAAKKAQCMEFLEKLPQGIHSMAGDAGKMLSGGQRQRISLARAILKDAPIVVLDEATAYADPENEEKMEVAIAELVKGKTLVVIAHKLPAIMNADQICVMDHGKLVATGKHQELIQSCPEYQKLWKAAQDSAEWKVHTAKEGK